jgi:hypothetical protein
MRNEHVTSSVGHLTTQVLCEKWLCDWRPVIRNKSGNGGKDRTIWSPVLRFSSLCALLYTCFPPFRSSDFLSFCALLQLRRIAHSRPHRIQCPIFQHWSRNSGYLTVYSIPNPISFVWISLFALFLFPVLTSPRLPIFHFFADFHDLLWFYFPFFASFPSCPFPVRCLRSFHLPFSLFCFAFSASRSSPALCSAFLLCFAFFACRLFRFLYFLSVSRHLPFVRLPFLASSLLPFLCLFSTPCPLFLFRSTSIASWLFPVIYCVFVFDSLRFVRPEFCPFSLTFFVSSLLSILCVFFNEFWILFEPNQGKWFAIWKSW